MRLHHNEVADVLAKLRFVPWHVEFRFDLDVIEMIGESKWFEEQPKGNEAPLYEITLEKRMGETFIKEVRKQ